MTGHATLSADSTTLTVRVPMSLAIRGGRKVVALVKNSARPTGTESGINASLVKALARAFWWRKLLETGVHSTVDDVAKAERLNPSYVSRVLRLTLLAPAIVEAILDGRQSERISSGRLFRPFPAEWARQDD